MCVVVSYLLAIYLPHIATVTWHCASYTDPMHCWRKKIICMGLITVVVRCNLFVVHITPRPVRIYGIARGALSTPEQSALLCDPVRRFYCKWWRTSTSAVDWRQLSTGRRHSDVRVVYQVGSKWKWMLVAIVMLEYTFTKTYTGS